MGEEKGQSIFADISNVTMNNAKLKVIGIGGGGGNAVQKMINSNLQGVQFITANTDLQALSRSSASVKIQLGEKLTNGLGAGTNPQVGRDAAIESVDAIKEAIGDANMVFLTAGMGGGTGTGATPVIAQIAKEMNALTVAIVTKPFTFEGKFKIESALNGIEELRKNVDSLLIIPNDRLFSLKAKEMKVKDMFSMADEVLFDAVRGISDVIIREGEMNVDFADIRTIMQETGLALMGTGRASGENRAIEATEQAIMSPLLEDVSLESAKAILYNITASDDLRGDELSEIGYRIANAALNQPIIKYGLVFDENMGDSIQVTVIATGIEPTLPEEEAPVIQPASANTLRFPSSNGRSSQKNQPELIYEPAPVREDPAPQSRRSRRPEYYDEKNLDRIAYGQGTNMTNSSRGRHTPGKQSYTYGSYNDDDFELPIFLRSNAD